MMDPLTRKQKSTLRRERRRAMTRYARDAMIAMLALDDMLDVFTRHHGDPSSMDPGQIKAQMLDYYEYRERAKEIQAAYAKARNAGARSVSWPLSP